MKAIRLTQFLQQQLDRCASIDDQTLKSICKYKGGKQTCRYIMNDGKRFICVKGSKVQESIDSFASQNAMVSGDNCIGLNR